MARAHRVNGMTGHLGAALVAGYCFAREHDALGSDVASGIEGELERVIAVTVENVGPAVMDAAITIYQVNQTTDGVRSRIADLKVMESTLNGMANQCEGGAVPDCPIVDTLFAGAA